ncbi:MAG: hypothetical protein R3F61_24340 [Myxococcota bacterium]
MVRLLHDLRWGFPVPGAQVPWGSAMARFGVEGARQLTLDGTVSFAGLELYVPTLVGGTRDLVRVVTYEVRAPPDRAALEAVLGEGRVQVLPNHGQPHQVAEVWTWDCGHDVSFAISVFAAQRGAAIAGVYLTCEDERLARPYVAALTDDAPWRRPGTVEALDVRGLEPCALTDAQLALRRPGLQRPADWAPTGLWRSAGSWGLADGRVTTVFREGTPVALVHERTLPARGPGGSCLRADGVVALVSSDPYGLDGLVSRLARISGVTVVLEVHHAD